MQEFLNKIHMKTNLKKGVTGVKGFTLIELLIVITIIGILAVAFLPSVFSATPRARDAARKADVGKIISNIETYANDGYGYPSASGCLDQTGIATVDPTNKLKTYFKGLAAPKDPSNGGIPGCTSGYYYCKQPGTNNINYAIIAKMELANDANSGIAAANVAAKCQPGGDLLSDMPFTPPSTNDPNTYLYIQTQ